MKKHENRGTAQDTYFVELDSFCKECEESISLWHTDTRVCDACGWTDHREEIKKKHSRSCKCEECVKMD